MKKLFIGLVVFALLALTVSAQITYPTAGSELCKLKTVVITWNPSSIPATTVLLRLRKGTLGAPGNAPPSVEEITDSAPNSGTFSWTVPDVANGTDYYLRIRPGSSDATSMFLDSPHFTIKSCPIDPGILEKLKRIRYWEIKWPPGPDPCMCPEWKLPDLRDFRELLGNQFAGRIVLMKNGAKLQELGKFGGRRALPGSVKANLSKLDFGLLKNGGAKFSIAILDSNGSILNESMLEQSGPVLR